MKVSTPSPTAGQRSMNRRMMPTEAARLLSLYRAMPQSAYYLLESEYSGKTRKVTHDDAVYVLTARGLLN